jgi:hypothetical protein
MESRNVPQINKYRFGIILRARRREKDVRELSLPALRMQPSPMDLDFATFLYGPSLSILAPLRKMTPCHLVSTSHDFMQTHSDSRPQVNNDACPANVRHTSLFF